MLHGSQSSHTLSFTRRHFVVNIFVAAMLALALTVQSAAPASASIGWCRSDPIVAVDLVVADVFTSAKWSDLGKVTGPTQIVVVVPGTAKALIGIPTVGFGYGERVSFERSSALRQTWSRIQVIVKVFVPSSDSSMPIQVQFAPRLLGLLAPTSAKGYANSWIVFGAVL